MSHSGKGDSFGRSSFSSGDSFRHGSKPEVGVVFLWYVMGVQELEREDRTSRLPPSANFMHHQLTTLVLFHHLCRALFGGIKAQGVPPSGAAPSVVTPLVMVRT